MILRVIDGGRETSPPKDPVSTSNVRDQLGRVLAGTHDMIDLLRVKSAIRMKQIVLTSDETDRLADRLLEGGDSYDEGFVSAHLRNAVTPAPRTDSQALRAIITPHMGHPDNWPKNFRY